MKSFFLSISIFFCFLSCKTQEVKGINKYSTSSEVSAVTVDLPKSIQVPEIIKETIKETLPPIIIQKDSSKAIPNSVLISPTPIENPSSQTGTVSENTDSSVHFRLNPRSD